MSTDKVAEFSVELCRTEEGSFTLRYYDASGEMWSEEMGNIEEYGTDLALTGEVAEDIRYNALDIARSLVRQCLNSS